jgi:hypothetical protein
VKNKLLALLVASLFLLGSFGVANATLITIGQATYSGTSTQVSDNDGSYNMVYDNDSPFGSVVYLNFSNSGANWTNQMAWASSLNTAGNLSYTLNPGYSVDWGANLWRLPSTVDNSSAWSYYNTTSEFGHLYYTELGNTGAIDYSGFYPLSWGLTNKGDLTNLLQTSQYWSGTEYAAIPGTAWYFRQEFGNQAYGRKEFDFLIGLAVRSGQVTYTDPNPPPVTTPEPTTMLLLGLGLMGLVGAKRKFHK